MLKKEVVEIMPTSITLLRELIKQERQLAEGHLIAIRRYKNKLKQIQKTA